MEDEELREGLIEFIAQAPKASDSGLFSIALKATLKNTRYKWNAHLKHPATGANVLMQALPSGEQLKPFRLEFSPASLGPEGMMFFREQWSKLTYDEFTYEDLAEVAKVTRLDIAVDLVNVGMGDIILEHKGSGKSHRYYSDTGKIETVYLGVKAGPNTKKAAPIKVYDKAKQLAETTQEVVYGAFPHTRVEISAHTGHPLAKLPSLKNRLKKVSVLAPIDCDPPDAAHTWNLFLHACRCSGVDAGLVYLPSDQQAAYMNALTSSGAQLWRADDIWNHWEDSLQRSGLLP